MFLMFLFHLLWRLYGWTLPGPRVSCFLFMPFALSFLLRWYLVSFLERAITPPLFPFYNVLHHHFPRKFPLLPTDCLSITFFWDGNYYSREGRWLKQTPAVTHHGTCYFLYQNDRHFGLLTSCFTHSFFASLTPLFVLLFPQVLEVNGWDIGTGFEVTTSPAGMLISISVLPLCIWSTVQPITLWLLGMHRDCHVLWMYFLFQLVTDVISRSSWYLPTVNLGVNCPCDPFLLDPFLDPLLLLNSPSCDYFDTTFSSSFPFRCLWVLDWFFRAGN